MRADDGRGQVDRNGQKARQHELDTALRLASLGYDVRFLPRLEERPSPDFELNGDQLWEAKSPIGSSRDTIQRQFRHAGRQGVRLVLDLSRVEGDPELLLTVVRQAASRYTSWSEVLVIAEINGEVRILAHLGR